MTKTWTFTPRRAGLALAAAIASLAVLPAAAPAATFCVGDFPNCAGTSKPGVKSALDAAQANGPSKDLIQVGQGAYNDGPYVDVPGNPVKIVGVAPNKVSLSAPTGSNATTIFDVQEPTTELVDLRVHADNAAATTVLKLRGAATRNVAVTNQGSGPTDGYQLTNNASVLDGFVDLLCKPGARCIAAYVPEGAGTPMITDAVLRGTVGVYAQGNANVRRSRIRAAQGVVAVGGSHTTVRDTMISLPAADDDFTVAGLVAGGFDETRIDADRNTIAGEGTGTGVLVTPNSFPGSDSAVDLKDSVVHNVQTALEEIDSGANGTGAIAVSWTAFKSASTSGNVVDGGNNLDLTNVEPGLRLSYSGTVWAPMFDSLLVDRGDPATNPAAFDAFHHTRVVDGDAEGGARVDLGAIEYQRAAPVAAMYAPNPSAAPTGKPITFSAGGTTDADPGDVLKFMWTFDDGTTAKGSVVKHAFATGGQHTATLTVTDSLGLSDTATGTVTILGLN